MFLFYSVHVKYSTFWEKTQQARIYGIYEHGMIQIIIPLRKMSRT